MLGNSDILQQKQAVDFCVPGVNLKYRLKIWDLNFGFWVHCTHSFPGWQWRWVLSCRFPKQPNRAKPKEALKQEQIKSRPPAKLHLCTSSNSWRTSISLTVVLNLPLSIGSSCPNHLCWFHPGSFEAQLRSFCPGVPAESAPRSSALWGLSHTCLHSPQLLNPSLVYGVIVCFRVKSWFRSLQTHGCWVQSTLGRLWGLRLRSWLPWEEQKPIQPLHCMLAGYPTLRNFYSYQIPAWVRLLEWLFSLCSSVKCHLAALENQQKHFPAATAVPERICAGESVFCWGCGGLGCCQHHCQSNSSSHAVNFQILDHHRQEQLFSSARPELTIRKIVINLDYFGICRSLLEL